MTRFIFSWKLPLILILISFTTIVFTLPLNQFSRFLLMLSCLNFVFFTVYFRNIYNPASVFGSLFFFMIGCSQARLTDIEQDPWDIHTWYAIVSVLIVFYVIIGLYILFYKRMLPELKSARKYRVTGYVLLISNFICVIAELLLYFYAFNKIGAVPIFNDEARANVMPLVINNYLMTLMAIPAFFVIFNTIYIVKTRRYYFLFFSAIFIILLTSLGGRINVFIPVITSLFYLLIQYVFDRGNLKHVIFTGLVTLLVTATIMVAIPLIRTSIYSGSGAEYYSVIYSEKTNVSIPSSTLVLDQQKNKGDTINNDNSNDVQPSFKLPARLLPIWINLSTEMHAFNKMVIYFNYTHDWRYGEELLTGTFNFIGKHFVHKRALDLEKMGGYNWINVMTFMQHPYMDFGIYGVIGFMIFFTTFGMHLYIRVQKHHTLMNTLYYSYFCMTMLFMVFDNHYYYSTVIVNFALLSLFKVFMQVDWLKQLHKIKSRYLLN